MSDTIPQNIPLKQCQGECKQYFPATTQFFHRTKRNPDGLCYECKTCRNARSRRDYHKPKMIEVNRIRNKIRNAKQAEYRKQWRETHKDHSNKWAREYRIRNLEKIRAREKRLRQRNRDRVLTYYRKYYWGHRDARLAGGRKRYTLNKEHIRKRNQAYHKTPKGRMVAYTAYMKRRAFKRNAEGFHTGQQIREQYERQKGECYYCQQKVVWGNHHREHVIPLSRGGSNDISNIVISCPTCNFRKNDKLPHEWPEGGRLL